MLREFKTFIARGNVMDMAVGIIIGAAFTAIVTSLVSDLINPVIGVIVGGLDFSNLFVVLGGSGPYATLAEARDAGAAVFAYGAFATAVINFVIVAFVVFMLVRQVNRIKDAVSHDAAPAPDPAPDPGPDPGPSEKDILIEIRDALRRG